MPNADAIRVLFVETIDGNGQAAETFLKGMNRNDIVLRTVTTGDDIKKVGHEGWDAVLLDVGGEYGKKEDLEAKVKLYCGKIPIIDLGHGAGESITSGNMAGLESYFRPVNVSTLVLLGRSTMCLSTAGLPKRWRSFRRAWARWTARMS